MKRKHLHQDVIIIQSGSDKIVANIMDCKSVARAMNAVIEKYGLNIEVRIKEKIKSKLKGMDWLKDDEEFKW